MRDFVRIGVAVALVAALGVSITAKHRCDFRFRLSPLGWQGTRTMFVGDSITRRWDLPQVNLGEMGETTEYVRRRFEQAHWCHCYSTMVLLAGTNDVLYRVDPAVTETNLSAVVREARASGVHVYLATLPPMFGQYAAENRAINQLNIRIARLAGEESATLLDFHAVLAGHPEYFSDDTHPNAQGYTAMTKALRSAGLIREEQVTQILKERIRGMLGRGHDCGLRLLDHW